jgi:hypothetical protein
MRAVSAALVLLAGTVLVAVWQFAPVAFAHLPPHPLPGYRFEITLAISLAIGFTGAVFCLTGFFAWLVAFITDRGRTQEPPFAR